MLRHELYSMIHVPRLKDENAAELFLGFRIGINSNLLEADFWTAITSGLPMIGPE
jgi:hypothetical protein